MDENTTLNPAAEPVDDSFAGLPEAGVMPINVEDEMQNSYIDYSMSVIVGRALPDARDGLKPVHRRCLFTMSELKNTHDKPHKKSARIVGEVMGKYHPHGDSSIYETIVRMAQPFSMRYMLVDGHGNFGSVDGDGAAAMRYTEVRMQRLAEDMLADLEKETVDMGPNYDETEIQPLVLPSKVPNLLLNGSVGIAVGMATNIPPHNLGELCDAVAHLVENPGCTIDDLMRFVKGPDFPTGAAICGVRAIESMYKLGRGVMSVRGTASIEERGNDSRIIITELPYGVNKAAMIEHIAELVKDKQIEGIRDIRDESKADVRVVVELKRDAMAQIVLNQLYKSSQLQTTFGATMLALDHGRPKVMNLKQLLRCFVDHRVEVITRRAKFDLRKARERCHILEGFRVALDNMDEIVRIIRASRDDAEVRARFHEQFGLDDLQTGAILEMRLRQLTGLARDKIEDEYRAILLRIEDLEDILAKPSRVLDIIKSDCAELKLKYADERRTEIQPLETEVNMEDLIANEPCIVTLSNRGYIKRTPLADLSEQGRGGKGRRGAKLRDEDFVIRLFTPMTHDKLVFITSHGRIFTEKTWQIPEGDLASLGKPLVNVLQLRPEIPEGRTIADPDDGNKQKHIPPRPAERVIDITPIEDFADDKYLFFATRKGIVKRTRLSEFKNVHKAGINAIKIDDDDELINALLVEDDDEVVLVTALGRSARFKVSETRAMGRAARGVKGIRLKGVTVQTDADDPAEENADNADNIDNADDAPEAASEANEANEAPAPDPTDPNAPRDSVRALVKVDSDPDARILVIVEQGYGKLTRFDAYPTKHRGTGGVKSIDTSARNGTVVFASEVKTDDSLMVITVNGITLRTAVSSIRETGRIAKGVRIVRVDDDDKVASAAVVEKNDADPAPAAAEAASDIAADTSAPAAVPTEE